MQKEMIRDFTLKISQSNKSELIVVMFEIMNVYFEDAKKAASYDDFKENIRNAQAVIYDLRKSLDRKYEISAGLYSLYSYWYKELELMVVKNDKKNLDAVAKMSLKIKEAFKEAAKADMSKPVMSNTEKVYAGLTYGKGELAETTDITNSGRGFFA
ncbi:MAG: flagellar protein FliS [Eubacterium sp.]|nr:flagellar protein FliS [Eubacterium sp.]